MVAFAQLSAFIFVQGALPVDIFGVSTSMALPTQPAFALFKLQTFNANKHGFVYILRCYGNIAAYFKKS